MAFTGLATLAVLAYLHGVEQMFKFIGKYTTFVQLSCLIGLRRPIYLSLTEPVWASLFSYFMGVVFYVTRFPECLTTADRKCVHWLDFMGGGSHAIWHAFIVLAISQHKAAIGRMRNGIECMAP
jgi:adiponectin receptor